MEKIQFTIDGLSCDACTKIVKNRLTKNISGIEEVSVEKNGNATIVSSSNVTKEMIESALADTDFKFVSFK